MEPFLGQIMPVGFNFAPRGWALCDGGLLAISAYSALFSLLGTAFGGDGRTTFALPDLRGRIPMHVGTGPGLNPVSWGQKAGSDTHTLHISEMPSHNHVATAQASKNEATSLNPKDNVWAVDEGVDNKTYGPAANLTNMAPQAVTTAFTGGGSSFNIQNPYLGIYFCIALTGIYPSRN